MRISDWSSDVWSSDLSLIVKPLTSAALCERFVAAATAKFARNVPDFVRLQSLVAERGGSFRNDHAAIRSADPQVCAMFVRAARMLRSEEHTSELQSLMRSSYAVFCLKKKNDYNTPSH